MSPLRCSDIQLQNQKPDCKTSLYANSLHFYAMTLRRFLPNNNASESQDWTLLTRRQKKKHCNSTPRSPLKNYLFSNLSLEQHWIHYLWFSKNSWAVPVAETAHLTFRMSCLGRRMSEKLICSYTWSGFMGMIAEWRMARAWSLRDFFVTAAEISSYFRARRQSFTQHGAAGTDGLPQF